MQIPGRTSDSQLALAAGRFDEALASFDAELVQRPGDANALFGRATALKGLGRHQEACDVFDAILLARPNAAGALNNRGDSLLILQRPAEALVDFERAIAFSPSMAQAHLGKGIALQRLERPGESLPCFDQALKLWPDCADAFFFAALSLERLGRLEEAVAHYDKAAVLEPDSIPVLANRATILLKLKRYAEASAGFEKVNAMAPGNAISLNGLAYAAAHACDWRRWDEFRTRIAASLRAGEHGIQPGSLMPYSNQADLMLAAAKNVTGDLPKAQKPLWRKPFSAPKIRLAYCSWDFHTHVTARVMVDVFDRHDRDRFELTAIDFGPDDGSPIRQRIRHAFHHFHEVANKSPLQIAQLMADQGIDIAVDLKGLTDKARPAIFAYRPVPVQAAYLGYCGTVGVDFMDYVLVDRIVVPPEEQAFYPEKLIYLPDSYYPTDSTLQVGPPPLSPEVGRAEAGLPSRGFVFCCFNNSWKITPAVFAVWMRLLKAVPESVLWLIADNQESAANLRASAAAHGFSERVILAPRTTPAGHLARHQLADLVLDTPVYNAHTTATDALWINVPVVTCVGDGWTGRVGASLLTAIGMPELITHNLDDYEKLALALASDPARLKAVKDKLAANRLTTPLFDTARLTRNMEAAYEKMRETFLSAQR
jgi:predicted O-linked N-acetylglucosamine transferase (SPINDLY family)